jgi:hypothetical protein
MRRPKQIATVAIIQQRATSIKMERGHQISECQYCSTREKVQLYYMPYSTTCTIEVESRKQIFRAVLVAFLLTPKYGHFRLKYEMPDAEFLSPYITENVQSFLLRNADVFFDSSLGSSVLPLPFFIFCRWFRCDIGQAIGVRRTHF